MTIVEELRKDRESGARRLESEYKAGLMILARRLYADPSDAEELVNRTFAADGPTTTNKVVLDFSDMGDGTKFSTGFGTFYRDRLKSVPIRGERPALSRSGIAASGFGRDSGFSSLAFAMERVEDVAVVMVKKSYGKSNHPCHKFHIVVSRYAAPAGIGIGVGKRPGALRFFRLGGAPFKLVCHQTACSMSLVTYIQSISCDAKYISYFLRL